MLKITPCKLFNTLALPGIIVLSLLFSVPLSGQNKPDSLKLLMKEANELRKGELNLELATYFLSQNPDSAIYYSNAAIKTAGNKNHTVIIRAYAKIGEAYQKQNNMKQSIAYYLNGLKLAEKYNEKSLAGTIYNGIATCYFYLNDLEKAEKYFRLAAKAKRDANDYQYYAFITTNIASLQIAKQSYNEAVKTLKDAEKALIKNKQDQYLSTVYNSLGAAYQAVKPDSCLYFYNKSAAIALKYDDALNQMTANQNIGDYYLGMKDYATAIKYMKTAIAVNDKRPEDQFKSALYDRIALAYESAGDFKNAYHYKKLENDARQHLFTLQKQKEVNELEIRYQTEKKEKEIQLGKQEIERSKNERNILLFGAIVLFIITGFVTYMIFNRRKTKQQFEQEKLKMFENIFHEIRTPLTLIDGPIQVMKKEPELKQNKELLLVERNSKRLMRLVNELLDASKLGKGSFQVYYTAGNVGNFIDEVVTNFESEAALDGKKIVNEKTNTDGYYSFPYNALEKVLSNLLSNAIKYSHKGSLVQVSSCIEQLMLVIKISDNGPGIPLKEQAKVFNRFFRGKYSAGTNGTGIGLSLVKELVELAGGNISLQSTPEGTVFTITIPLQEFNASQQNENVESDTPTLLLAEDDADTAAFTVSVLETNFKVIHANNGTEALSIIRENLPDIVLSDVMMPQKDGIELLADIRSDELYSHIPVVLFSAKASLESRIQALGYGADAYIAKPFLPDELRLTVNNLFNTALRNRQLYRPSAQSALTFDERIKSDNSYVNKVIEKIIDNIDDPEYSVNELSSDMAVSRSQLHRKLTALTGFSTTNFIRMVRLEKAKDLLMNNDGNISEIAYRCGFNSQSYFTKSFTEYFGESPSHFTKNQ